MLGSNTPYLCVRARAVMYSLAERRLDQFPKRHRQCPVQSMQALGTECGGGSHTHRGQRHPLLSPAL